jgi:hypothetical protein
MWVQIKDFNYEINEQGVVRNTRTGKIRNPFNRKDGYIGIQLYVGKVLNFQLHRLIALAFIPNPDNKPQVNHIDSNRKNNDLSNLEWVSCSENVKHGYELGRASNKGSKNGFSVLNEDDVLAIRKRRSEDNLSYQTLANLYNVSYGCIAGIIQRKNWTHI